jgi:hypothetical protein
MATFNGFILLTHIGQQQYEGQAFLRFHVFMAAVVTRTRHDIALYIAYLVIFAGSAEINFCSPCLQMARRRADECRAER